MYHLQPLFYRSQTTFTYEFFILYIYLCAYMCSSRRNNTPKWDKMFQLWNHPNRNRINICCAYWILCHNITKFRKWYIFYPKYLPISIHDISHHFTMERKITDSYLSGMFLLRFFSLLSFVVFGCMLQNGKVDRHGKSLCECALWKSIKTIFSARSTNKEKIRKEQNWKLSVCVCVSHIEILLYAEKIRCYLVCT